MLQNLTLRKPLVVIDVETTGTDASRDRIVEISVLKLHPDGRHVQRTRRVNPRIPIPVSATEVHGISDADVVDSPSFADIAEKLLAWIDDADFCGYNLKKFDLRVLVNEFNRVGRKLNLENRAVIDPMEIFFRYEPRDLAAAAKRYLGREHDEAHSAEADAIVTAQILDAMVGCYEDLPCTVQELHQEFVDRNHVDSNGFFRRVEGEVRFVKGKFRGQPLSAVATSSPDYLNWMLSQDFFDDTKAVISKALIASLT